MLETLRRRSEERGWLKQQSSGELDDARLVDGLAGERQVFKRRGSLSDPFQDPNKGKGKARIYFALDVSGSMYRFNGQVHTLGPYPSALHPLALTPPSALDHLRRMGGWSACSSAR